MVGVEKEVVSVRNPSDVDSEGWRGFDCNCFAIVKVGSNALIAIHR